LHPLTDILVIATCEVIAEYARARRTSSAGSWRYYRGTQLRHTRAGIRQARSRTCSPTGSVGGWPSCVNRSS
jgi:hypothetical protein